MRNRELCLCIVLLAFVVVRNWADEHAHNQDGESNDHQSEETPREEKVMQMRPDALHQRPGGFNGKDRGEVSETDVFLLEAIEKMAYRLSFVEKRLRRAEDLLFHLMEQNTAHKQPGEKADPCPGNFTRVMSGCYYFSSDPIIHRGKQSAVTVNWQEASGACKKLAPGANLVEFESIEETQDVIAHVKSGFKLRDKSYWTGGLNPGLLWIWADSGRPITTTNDKNKKPSVGNRMQDIRGSGRCLLMGYDASLRSYNLIGSDCAYKQYYICEAEDNRTDRALERIQRNLKLGIGLQSQQ